MSHAQILRFLEDELAIAPAAIAIAQRVYQQSPGPLHMILWQHGLLSLQQLEQVFDWLEGRP